MYTDTRLALTSVLFVFRGNVAVEKEAEINADKVEGRLDREKQAEGLLLAVAQIVDGLDQEEQNVDPEDEVVEAWLLYLPRCSKTSSRASR